MAALRSPSGKQLLAAAGVAAAGALIARQLARSSDSTSAPERATYPPLDTPKPIANGLWVVDSGPLHVLWAPLPVRMTVIRLANGDLFLHSPTRFTPELGEALRALGTVRHLVAPNIAHWIFLPDWQRAFPDAITWGAPGLKERAQVRASPVRINTDLSGEAPTAWADEITQGVVSGGAGFYEVWFFHRASRTLLLVDLIENLEPAKLTPVARVLMGAAAATRGTTARYLRVPVRLGGERAKEAVRSMLALEPERVIFAHGRIFADRASERLKQAFSWLV